MYSLLKTLNANSPGAMDRHVGIENLTDCAFPHFRGCYLIAEMRVFLMPIAMTLSQCRVP